MELELDRIRSGLGDGVDVGVRLADGALVGHSHLSAHHAGLAVADLTMADLHAHAQFSGILPPDFCSLRGATCAENVSAKASASSGLATPRLAMSALDSNTSRSWALIL